MECPGCKNRCKTANAQPCYTFPGRWICGDCHILESVLRFHIGSSKATRLFTLPVDGRCRIPKKLDSNIDGMCLGDIRLLLGPMPASFRERTLLPVSHPLVRDAVSLFKFYGLVDRDGGTLPMPGAYKGDAALLSTNLALLKHQARLLTPGL